MMLSSKMVQRFVFDTLEKGIQIGTLYVRTPENLIREIKGAEPGTVAHWHIKDWKAAQIIASRGDVGLGESYVQGLWDSPDLESLFRIFIDNLEHLDAASRGSWLSQLWYQFLNHVVRRNSVSGSRSNIRSHYDVGNDFYKLWLDPSMTYSSALYTDEHTPLEVAQANKYQRILNRITDGRKRVLEIGCGWGGFAEQAASRGHAVTGLTLSSQQHDFALRRLGNAADIRIQDYRHVEGKFDAIASIEMFEAVGIRYWPDYFRTLKNRLAKDGVAMVQTITIKDYAFDQYLKTSDYIRHYVFPGGLLPSVKKFNEFAEKSGLVCKDVFSFGQDYARTLREWLNRFDASEPAIRALGYSTEFIRSWRIYLHMCAASFANSRTNVVQIELVHA